MAFENDRATEVNVFLFVADLLEILGQQKY